MVAVIVILGILAAFAVPRFVGLPDDVHKIQVKATATSMRTSVNLIKGKARVSDMFDEYYGEPTFKYSYGGKTGEVAMYPDMTGAPFTTSDLVDEEVDDPTRSYKLWDLLVRTPSIKDREQEPKETGWYSNEADAFGDSWVYGWEYWVNNQLYARLIYNATEKAGGSVEIDWDPDEF